MSAEITAQYTDDIAHFQELYIEGRSYFTAFLCLYLPGTEVYQSVFHRYKSFYKFQTWCNNFQSKAMALTFRDSPKNLDIVKKSIKLLNFVFCKFEITKLQIFFFNLITLPYLAMIVSCFLIQNNFRIAFFASSQKSTPFSYEIFSNLFSSFFKYKHKKIKKKKHLTQVLNKFKKIYFFFQKLITFSEKNLLQKINICQIYCYCCKPTIKHNFPNENLIQILLYNNKE